MRHRKWFVVMGAVVLCLNAAYGYAYDYKVTGWNREGVNFMCSTCGAEGIQWDFGGTDIDGEVGHPLTVKSPTMACPGDWYARDTRIVSGTLPPGLTFDKSGNISGIPTERGHWVMMVGMYNIQCNGESAKGFTQQLRFHITGTGKVID